MRLPAFVRNWLHDRYCCHPHELLDQPPPMADYHEFPDGKGGTIVIPEMKGLSASLVEPPTPTTRHAAQIMDDSDVPPWPSGVLPKPPWWDDLDSPLDSP